jgi:hypothetical protein
VESTDGLLCTRLGKEDRRKEDRRDGGVSCWVMTLEPPTWSSYYLVGGVQPLDL